MEYICRREKSYSTKVEQSAAAFCKFQIAEYIIPCFNTTMKYFLIFWFLARGFSFSV